ncbi:hypothetical protein BRC82_04070 [Halobacteriales archaeon QS_1_67_19]|nr:MAG: hypothetical protein BRC82_04070 [Halobacteriales archaeon QS_1_67_19]
MNSNTLRINKRTVLGSQYWLIGAAGSLTLDGVLAAIPVVAIGAYLVAAPELSSVRVPRPSKFLLSAE